MGLVPLATVKAAISPVPPAGDDARLQGLIDMAGAWIEREAGVKVLSDTYDECYDGPGGPVLLLRQRPVTDVAEVEIDGRTLQPAVTTTDAGYTWDEYAVRLRCDVFRRGIRNVRVLYTAGAEETPADLAEVVIQAVALAYKRAPHLDYQSKQLAGEVITFWNAALPPQALRVLEAFKRRMPA